MWKARGDVGLEKLVDNTMECARYLSFFNKVVFVGGDLFIFVLNFDVLNTFRCLGVISFDPYSV